MPILPLEHPEPFAATLGVMLYPGTGNADPRKAIAFASNYLAEPIRQLHEAGRTIAHDDLARIVEGGGEHLDDLDERWWRGTATGEMFNALFALADASPDLASWNKAARIGEKVALRTKSSGSRSSLWKARSQFLSVAHLWAAWCIREGNFETDANVGYDGWSDFQSFLTEAEILRDFGQHWRSNRAKSAPPLPEEVWRVPVDWEPPERQPGWPDTGKIPRLELPHCLIADLKPPGRPKKSS